MNTEPRARLLFIPLLIVVTALSLFARIDNVSFFENSLWAEDGTVLINQAHENGIRSLWQPHAGQLLLYPRLVALLTKDLPLAAIPYIYSLAWSLAFLSIAWALHRRQNLTGLDGWLIALLVAAISLQPNHGETIFVLSGSHFYLGIAMAFLICIPSKKAPSPTEIIFLIIASLSGPFSTFMIATLAIQLFILRDFSIRKWTYAIVSTCGLIQSFYVVTSSRISGSGRQEDVSQWLHAAGELFFFGKSDTFTLMVAATFWLVTLAFFCKSYTPQRWPPDSPPGLAPFFAALTGVLLFLIGALAMGSFLHLLTPLGIGSRYFLIPYSMAFYVSLVCTTNHRAAQTTILALISAICASGFLTVDRPDRASIGGALSLVDMQWTAFTKFRDIKQDLAIPINPLTPTYPPLWIVRLDTSASGVTTTPELPPHFSLEPRRNEAIPMEADPPFHFDITGHCTQTRYLAIEIDMWRSRMGWATLSWGHEPKHSMSRFYPSGLVTMQFAFHRDASDNLIRLDPAQGVLDSEFVQRLNRTVPSRSRGGYIIAEPTPPGGEVEVKAVRLFCLR